MAVERLRTAIIDAELPFGAPLSESALAQSLGISKTPVREALAQLQSQGLVTIIAQKGSFVFNPTAEQVSAICEFRLAIELYAVRLAHMRGRAALLADLREIVQRMTAARRLGDVLAYLRLDTRFHEAFFAHCGNPILRDAYELIAGKAAALRTQLSAPNPEILRKSYDEHAEMVELLEDDRLDDVITRLQAHIKRTEKLHRESLLARQDASEGRATPRRTRAQRLA